MTEDDSGYILNEEDIPQGFLSTKVEEIALTGYRCQGCGHEWRPRKKHPGVCPDCGASLIWNDDDEGEDEPDEFSTLDGEDADVEQESETKTEEATNETTIEDLLS